MASADAEGLAMPSLVCYRNIDGDGRVLSGHFGEEEVEGLMEMCGGEAVVGEFSERRVAEWMAVSLCAFLSSLCIYDVLGVACLAPVLSFC